MTLDLDTIKERHAAATKGPWMVHRGTGTIDAPSLDDEDSDWWVATAMREEDRTFIAHARADVPALVAEVERLRHELHDEQVRRNKWERMCEEMGLVELEPTPDTLPSGYNPPPVNLVPPERPPPPRPSDVLPCGHPREAVRGDVTHWCAMCESENWRVGATIDRLISNILAACKILREEGLTSLPFQLERDRDNLVYWQKHGGLVEANDD